MDCCQVDGIEEVMDAGMAQKDLKRYRKKGPDRTTQILLDAVSEQGVEGQVLLDIGGGVGALQHELLSSGVTRAVSVDASAAYLQAAREEAESRGHAERIRQHHGDFVKVANQLETADIVTLDRVVCCYDDVEGLVTRSAALASKIYGVVYPRDHWVVIALTWLENLYRRIRGSQFRAFAHPETVVEGLIRQSGLERCFSERTFLWNVHLYRRNGRRPARKAATGN